MRIRTVTTHILRNTPDPARLRNYSGGPTRDQHILLVELETDDGVVGWAKPTTAAPARPAP